MKKNLRILGIIIISTFNLVTNAEVKERIITVCKVTKNTYVHLNTDFSIEKKDQTLYESEEKENGEIYILSKFLTALDSEDRILMFDTRFYNISYQGKYSIWNTFDNLKASKDGIQVSILNEGNPFIMRIFYPRVQEQIYLFNIDNLGNGTMTMVNTRWNSPMNAANNQALFYAECKRP